MNELRRLWIAGPAGRLEAALRVSGSARGAAVIAHPHPLHGGTLDNPVVFHVDRELWRANFTTLRFNFRGVGTSEGSHDEARGEIDDVGAAVTWLRGISIGLPLFCVGYSFGSYCSARWTARDETVAGLIAIGLPLRAYDFTSLVDATRPLAVVQGSEDEFGAPAEVQALLAERHQPYDLQVIPSASHLFPDRARQVGATVVGAATRMINLLKLGLST